MADEHRKRSLQQTDAQRHLSYERCYTDCIVPNLERFLRTARRILGREDLVWDAVQVSLVKLWNEEPPPDNVVAWFSRTVLNTSLMSLRSEKRTLAREHRVASQRSEIGPRDDPLRAAQAAEFGAEIAAALAELSEEQRVVFVFHELEHLDYSAIGRKLGVPVGTIRSRLFRARRTLRDLLKDVVKAVETKFD